MWSFCAKQNPLIVRQLSKPEKQYHQWITRVHDRKRTMQSNKRPGHSPNLKANALEWAGNTMLNGEQMVVTSNWRPRKLKWAARQSHQHNKQEPEIDLPCLLLLLLLLSRRRSPSSSTATASGEREPPFQTVPIIMWPHREIQIHIHQNNL